MLDRTKYPEIMLDSEIEPKVGMTVIALIDNPMMLTNDLLEKVILQKEEDYKELEDGTILDFCLDMHKIDSVPKYYDKNGIEYEVVCLTKIKQVEYYKEDNICFINYLPLKTIGYIKIDDIMDKEEYNYAR